MTISEMFYEAAAESTSAGNYQEAGNEDEAKKHSVRAQLLLAQALALLVDVE